MDKLSLLDELAELKLLDMLRACDTWCFVADDAFHARLRGLLAGQEHRLLRLSDAASVTPRHLEGFEVGVICTNGSENLPREGVARRLSLRPLRLFADLVLRRAADAPLLSSVPAEVPPADLSYAILCLARCGSTLLSKELELLGLGRPKEHFRAPIVTLLRHRDLAGFSLERWWALVRAAGVQDGVFGTKILYEFFVMAADNMEPGEQAWFMGQLRRLPVIRILRRNKVDQAVSDYVARKTGVWHLWNAQIKAGYANRLEAVADDMPKLVSLYQKFSENEDRLDRMLRDAGISPIDVEYDELAARPKETVAAVARRLGRPVPESYLESSVTLEPTRTGTHARLAAKLAAELA